MAEVQRYNNWHLKLSGYFFSFICFFVDKMVLALKKWSIIQDEKAELSALFFRDTADLRVRIF